MNLKFAIWRPNRLVKKAPWTFFVIKVVTRTLTKYTCLHHLAIVGKIPKGRVLTKSVPKEAKEVVGRGEVCVCLNLVFRQEQIMVLTEEQMSKISTSRLRGNALKLNKIGARKQSCNIIWSLSLKHYFETIGERRLFSLCLTRFLRYSKHNIRSVNNSFFTALRTYQRFCFIVGNIKTKTSFYYEWKLLVCI